MINALLTGSPHALASCCRIGGEELTDLRCFNINVVLGAGSDCLVL